uniref:Uncharacterized protein n=1 Tax=Pipistrellus kuhlii TaxID=59472 RepID=A0A7J7R492_PIPKU|nr:hypothetical protein mPipKuh1_010849 [Pipistrellus kuhlii]
MSPLYTVCVAPSISHPLLCLWSFLSRESSCGVSRALCTASPLQVSLPAEAAGPRGARQAVDSLLLCWSVTPLHEARGISECSILISLSNPNQEILGRWFCCKFKLKSSVPSKTHINAPFCQAFYLST